MTPEEFAEWLGLMRVKGCNKAECAAMLGRTPTWVGQALRRGTDRTTAWACSAILAGLEPFTSKPAVKSRPRSTGRASTVA